MTNKFSELVKTKKQKYWNLKLSSKIHNLSDKNKPFYFIARVNYANNFNKSFSLGLFKSQWLYDHRKPNYWH